MNKITVETSSKITELARDITFAYSEYSNTPASHFKEKRKAWDYLTDTENKFKEYLTSITK